MVAIRVVEARSHCHPERSEAESKDPVALSMGNSTGSLDFARGDSKENDSLRDSNARRCEISVVRPAVHRAASRSALHSKILVREAAPRTNSFLNSRGDEIFFCPNLRLVSTLQALSIPLPRRAHGQRNGFGRRHPPCRRCSLDKRRRHPWRRSDQRDHAAQRLLSTPLLVLSRGRKRV